MLFFAFDMKRNKQSSLTPSLLKAAVWQENTSNVEIFKTTSAPKINIIFYPTTYDFSRHSRTSSIRKRRLLQLYEWNYRYNSNGRSEIEIWFLLSESSFFLETTHSIWAGSAKPSRYPSYLQQITLQQDFSGHLNRVRISVNGYVIINF